MDIVSCVVGLKLLIKDELIPDCNIRLVTRWEEGYCVVKLESIEIKQMMFSKPIYAKQAAL